MVSSGKTSLFHALSDLIEGEIDVTEVALSKGSLDHSSIAVHPQAVLYPKTVKDIGIILKFGEEYHLPVSIRGKGGSTSGGSLTEGVQIDMSRHFTKIHAIDIKNNTATIGAGAEIKAIVSKLSEWGLTCPLFSFDVLPRTLGGLVSENAITVASGKHGDMRLWVDSLTLVLPNGEEHLIKDGLTPGGRLLEILENLHPLLHAKSKTVHAIKTKALASTSGYNVLNQGVGLKQILDIIVGSEGTLGIITSVTVRLLPIPKYSYTIATGASSFSEVRRLIDAYKKEDAESLYLCDGSLFKHVNLGKEPPSLAKVLHSPYIVVGTFSSKHENEMVRISGNAKENLFKKTEALFGEDGTFLAKNIYGNISSSLEAFAKHSYTPISIFDGMAIPEEAFAHFCEIVERKLEALDLPYVFLGNIGSFVVSLIFFINAHSELGKRNLGYALTDISKALEQVGGSPTGGNGDGIVRTPYMAVAADTHLRNLYREIQQLFDPAQVLNAGKKTFIGSEYTVKHIKKHTKEQLDA